jgi:membrane-bound serine protease (ClpP class)
MRAFFAAFAFLVLPVRFATGLPQASLSASPQPVVIRVTIDGPIHPITAEIVGDAITQARSQQAALVLLKLNTPGGLVDATREITQKIVASPVPVVAYVTPSGGRAASAGFFLLEAADVAAMAPGTNTGAASPVLLGETMDPVLRSKLENDAAALLRSVTARRHRNTELAEKAVREAKAFSESEALTGGLIDLQAADETALLRLLQGREVTRFDGSKQILQLTSCRVVDVHLTWREDLFRLIADPNIGLILLVLGVLGIYVEFNSPGVIFPGVVGALLAVLGLSSLAVLPINWTGAALLILGVAFFILEAKFSGHGVLGATGAVAMLLGAVILIDGPPEMRIRWSTAFALTVPFAVISIFLMSLVVKVRRTPVRTGATALVGETGVARTPLTPLGQVFLHGEYWQAVSSVDIEQGAPVKVKQVEGLKLYVEPSAEPATATTPIDS